MVNTKMVQFHFALGPVQGFVAESRRTRDLWASSYLLSYLTECALKVIEDAGHSTILPAQFPSIQRPGAQKSGELHGSTPNRFIAEIPLNEAQNIGELCAAAVLGAWTNLADAIWEKYVKDASIVGKDTRAIWERQVSSFWDIVWAAGDHSVLERRKNWRTPILTEEGGDHCTMMNNYQELSGYARNPKRQRAFWEKVKSRVGQLDIADDERLCAIALIKRLYPKISATVLNIDVNASSWPSTAYLAAVPWIKNAYEKDPEAAIDYGTFAKDNIHGGAFSEYQTEIKCLGAVPRDFRSLDGNLFFDNALTNEGDTPLESAEGIRDELAKRLTTMYQNKDIGQPGPIYALLLMDGDSMGKLIQQSGNISTVSSALTEFSQKVPEIVNEHNGVTVYAGGDDVLAMLPLPDAMKCAAALSRAYGNVFRDDNHNIQGATLSGAIVYTHYKTPYRTILTLAHHLLDDIAKDKTGRDSLAVAVYKGSGLNLLWSAPWDHIRKTSDGSSAETIIDELVEAFREKDEYSSGFFYRLRERFGLLVEKPLYTPGQWGKLAPDIKFAQILAADYIKGRKHKNDGVDIKTAIERMESLLKVSQKVTRKQVDGQQPQIDVDENTLGIDGALLVRFLATNGEGLQ